MSLDIATIRPTNRIIEITRPGKGDNIGIRVDIVSIDDERMKRLKRKIADERLRREQRGKGFKAEEVEENKEELAFSVMNGWEWYDQPEETDEKGNVIKEAVPAPNFNGSVPTFNRAHVMVIFKAIPWFLEQVWSEATETEDFFAN